LAVRDLPAHAIPDQGRIKERSSQVASYLETNDRKFIAAAMRTPLLEREHEADLGRRWRDKQDHAALDELITSHMRLVIRIAAGFRGYGLPLPDLIQEGNVGLMEAATRFDPERNVRFSTYATWWILAAVQEYIVRNSSIVRIGTTPAQKSLFFNLRRLRARLSKSPDTGLTAENRQTIAQELGVPLAAVERMEAQLSAPDRSLNAGIAGEDTDEMMDFLADERPTPEAIVQDMRDSATHAAWLNEALETLSPRERDIIRERFLGDEKVTLADIGAGYGVTKERIRQIEGRALAKLRTVLAERHGETAMAIAS
jgi:RNA polymerase sigma-32 factor